jgi:hypothetical protein
VGRVGPQHRLGRAGALVKRRGTKGTWGRKAPVSRAVRAILALPFVGKSVNPRSWWVVQSSGDFMADTDRGRDMALTFIRYLAEGNGSHSELGMIVEAQIAQGRPGTREGLGITLGFWWTISDALVVGGKAALARLPDYYAERRAATRKLEKEEEEEEERADGNASE